jgi:Domain of unknown function (DUF4214)
MLRGLASGLAALFATQALAGDLVWGVSGHPFAAYPDISYADQLDLVKALGTTVYRVDISSADQVPLLQDLVDLASERGITILPVLTPGLDLDNESPESLRDKAEAFARALAAPLHDAIPVWELGNEMENYALIEPCEKRDDGSTYPCEWGTAGGVEPLDYYGPRWAKVSAVLHGLADGIVSVDPTLRKAIGTAGWGHIGAFRRMHDDGIPWDISVWHMYGQDPEWALQLLDDYDRPIWVTEFNHPLGSSDGEDAQARGLAQTARRLSELSVRYSLEGAFVYELLDEPYWQPSFEAEMGLVSVEAEPDGKWTLGPPKPAFREVRKAILGHDVDPCAGGADDPAPADLAAEQTSAAFCHLLGRMPYPRERRMWTLALRRGDATGVDVLASLVQSPEFSTAHGLAAMDDAAYVGFVYDTLLRRQPDGGGMKDYTGQLATGGITRAGLALAALGSAEFPTANPLFARSVPVERPTVTRDCDLAAEGEPPFSLSGGISYAYCLMLGRDPTPAEVERWLPRLRSGGTSLRDLLPTLAQGPEFAERHQTADLTERGYIGLVYRLLLGREPDGTGLADYAAQIGSGAMTRADLLAAALASAEFATRNPALVDQAADAPRLSRDCDLAGSGDEGGPEGRAAYAACLVLGTPPTPAQRDAWAAALAGGESSSQALVLSMLGSEEFRQRYDPEALDDRGFVYLVYRLLLHREPDGTGLAGYAAELAADSLTREQLEAAAVESEEFSRVNAPLFD